MTGYTPRRCGKHWLDADCPTEVLAIIHHTEAHGSGYDVLYADVQTVRYEDSNRVETWLNGFSMTEGGAGREHFELKAHEVVAYRYRFKRRYAKWSTLPEPVKTAVRRDIAAAAEWAEAHA